MHYFILDFNEKNEQFFYHEKSEINEYFLTIKTFKHRLQYVILMNP